MGGINGLTILASPSGKLILYGQSDGRSVSMNLWDSQSREVSRVSLDTLPEKCAWASGNDKIYCSVPKANLVGQYPDIWYQGLISFSDSIWSIDVKTGNTELIVNPTIEAGVEIDGIKLSLSKKENKLYFVNKKDSYLWSLDLTK